MFLEISQSSQENTCARVFFLIKLQAKSATLLKKRLWHRCFPANYVKFLKTPFLQNTSGRLLLKIASLDLTSKFLNLKIHCVKSVQIRSYSGQHFPAFGLNMERYSIYLRIISECGKMWTRITPNTDTFYPMFTKKKGEALVLKFHSIHRATAVTCARVSFL